MSIWCDRSLFTVPFHYGLCIDEKTYAKELRGLGIAAADSPKFILNEWSHGTTHFFESCGKTCVIVCIKVENRTGIEVAGLLVHEAVHIWQEVRANTGEKQPSSEFEAYAVQHISQNLMWQFERQASISTKEK